MKRVILVLMLLASGVMAKGVEWREDFISAVVEARQSDKPVMFVVSSHNCKWCTVLKETTLSDPKVASVLNRDFVSVIAYKEDGHYIPGELNGRATPEIWFLTNKPRSMFAPIQGAIKSKEFLDALEVVKKEYREKHSKKRVSK